MGGMREREREAEKEKEKEVKGEKQRKGSRLLVDRGRRRKVESRD